MTPNNLTKTTTQELTQKLKTIKRNKIIDATLIGITVGVAIYSAVKNGLGFATFFPLVLAYVIIRNSKNNEILEKDIKSELGSR